jgi:glycosyltransferase involved in cell wall biosynthesis
VFRKAAPTSPSLGGRGISVVLPAHNEEAVIAGVVANCVEALARIVDDFEVIVVDDGSADRTGEIADGAAAADPRVRVVHTVTNRGYGGALRAGFDAAGKPLVFFMDSDGQFDIGDIARLVPMAAAGNPAVIGYRERRQDPPLRLVNAWAWNRLVRWLFHFRVRDIDCAFKLYDTSLVRSLDVQASGAMINTEMLAKVFRLGIVPVEVPVRHFPRLHGQPTGANLGVIVKAFGELRSLRRYLLQWTPLTSSLEPHTAEEELTLVGVPVIQPQSTLSAV